MTTDYEKYYQNNPHGLGEPTQEFVSFFNDYSRMSCEVLDIGCGQGRDALLMAMDPYARPCRLPLHEQAMTKPRYAAGGKNPEFERIVSALRTSETSIYTYNMIRLLMVTPVAHRL